MTPDEFDRGVAAVLRHYPETRILPAGGPVRPLRIAPIIIPQDFWGGGVTRLLIVCDLATHEGSRPRGLLGPEVELALRAASVQC